MGSIFLRAVAAHSVNPLAAARRQLVELFVCEEFNPWRERADCEIFSHAVRGRQIASDAAPAIARRPRSGPTACSNVG
jgi:hypothetical protein